MIDAHHPPLDIIIKQNSEMDTNITDIEVVIENLNFFHANYDLLNDYFENINWDFLCSCGRDIDLAIEMFYSVIYAAVDMFVPLKTKSILKYPSYFSKDTIKLISNKNTAFNRYKKTKLVSDETAYKRLRKCSKASISADYDRFLENTQVNILSNVKSLWSYIRSKRDVVGYPREMRYGDVISTSTQDTANLFSAFFQSVYVQYNDVHFDSMVAPILSDVNLYKIPVNSDIVFRKLIDLDVNKGAGPDMLPPVFFFRCSPTLAVPLSYIYSLSLNTGVFPTLWKFANITALFKTGNRNNVANYRPISGLNCAAKILEKIVTEVIFNTFKSKI